MENPGKLYRMATVKVQDYVREAEQERLRRLVDNKARHVLPGLFELVLFCLMTLAVVSLSI